MCCNYYASVSTVHYVMIYQKCPIVCSATTCMVQIIKNAAFFRVFFSRVLLVAYTFPSKRTTRLFSTDHTSPTDQCAAQPWPRSTHKITSKNAAFSSFAPNQFMSGSFAGPFLKHECIRRAISNEHLCGAIICFRIISTNL